MAFADVMRKFLGKDERLAEMQKEQRAQHKLVERSKNSNERELERFQEEARQEQIKKDLADFRQQKQDDLWRGPTILDSPNIFKGHKSILTENKNFMKNSKMTKHPGGFL